MFLTAFADELEKLAGPIPGSVGARMMSNLGKAQKDVAKTSRQMANVSAYKKRSGFKPAKTPATAKTTAAVPMQKQPRGRGQTMNWAMKQ